MVSDQGETKVVDLGLAKAIQSGDLLQTLDGIIMGTPQYMPLEQFVNSADVRPAADVYALGATLYFMLTGRDGIALDRFLEMRAQVESGFPDVRKERTDVPEELSDTFRRIVSLL
jgi:serine/threonine protein kinase